MELGDVVRYFRACYEADNSSRGVRDFLGTSVEHRWLTKSKEDLLTGDAPIIPVPAKQASAALKTLQLFGKEKELVYASLFVLRRANPDDMLPAKWCAPVFLFPAEITEKDGDYYLEPDLDRRRINPAILQLFKSNDTEIPDLYTGLKNAVQDDLLRFPEISKTVDVLKRLRPDLHAEAALLYPQLQSAAKIRASYKADYLEEPNSIAVVPASGFGVVDKSGNALGVLSELAHIADSAFRSRALEAVLDPGFIPRDQRAQKYYGRVPAILSKAQTTIAESACKHPTTVVIGPPGTGKSFTIASVALERLAAGESVLIVSRNDQAVDVVANKIGEQLDLPKLVVRAGTKRYLSKFKYRLRRLLNQTFKDLPREISQREYWQLASALKLTEKHIANLEEDFWEQAETELDWGGFFAQTTEPSLWDTVRKNYINIVSSFKGPQWKLMERIFELQDERTDLTIKVVREHFRKQVVKALGWHYTDFQSLSAGIESKRMVEREAHFAKVDFQRILKAFPIWLTKLSDLSSVLPLEAELFDVVIIDEATQCDPASVIPALQRAKRAVFAGDPDQLRHLSFLSRTRQQALQAQFNIPVADREQLNYRDKSALDLAAAALSSSDQVAFLNEHFRSTPEIIAFSNREFYNEELHIMTQHPGKANPTSLEWVRTTGTRLKKGHNPTEALAMLERVADLLDIAEASAGPPISIGLLSPFRDQVTHLRRELGKRFGKEAIERHKMLVGTAFQFQGEERDVMLLSFALSSNDHPSAFHYLTRSDMFNVSITRARHKQVVFTSFDPSILKQESLTWRFFHHLLASRQRISAAPNTHHDGFLNEVMEALAGNGFEFLPDHALGGMQIDLVVLRDGVPKGVDLIGFPGDFSDAFTLDRYYMLQRAGLRVFPLPFSYWTLDRERCLGELIEWLG